MARILFLVGSFPPEISTGRLEYQLSQSFRRNGHTVTVVTAFPRRYLVNRTEQHAGRFKYTEYVDGLRVIRMGPEFSSRDNLSARGFEYFFDFFSFLVGGAVAGKTDVIICSSPPLTLALAAYFLGRIKRAPVIVRIGDLHPQELVDMGLIKSGLIVSLLERIERFIYRSVDFSTVLSDGYKKHMLRRGAARDKISVIPNWGDPEELKTLKKENQVSRKHADKFQVVYAGAISWFQDIETMVDAATLLRDDADINFLIVGDGPRKRFLEEKAKHSMLGNLSFEPLKQRKEYLQLLQSSDVCVVSIRKEVKTTTVPSKLLDIMSCGRPVIADVPAGEVSNLIFRAKCGIWVEPGNARMFADAIVRLHKSRTMAARLGKNAREYLERNLTLQACAQQYETIIRELTDKNDTR